MDAAMKKMLLEAITRNPGQMLSVYRRETGNSALGWWADILLAEKRIFKIKNSQGRYYRYYPTQSTRFRKVPFFISLYVILSPKDASYGPRLVEWLERKKDDFDVSDHELMGKDGPVANKGEYLILLSF